jgi:hypothetical protein
VEVEVLTGHHLLAEHREAGEAGQQGLGRHVGP